MISEPPLAYLPVSDGAGALFGNTERVGKTDDWILGKTDDCIIGNIGNTDDCIIGNTDEEASHVEAEIGLKDNALSGVGAEKFACYASEPPLACLCNTGDSLPDLNNYNACSPCLPDSFNSNACPADKDEKVQMSCEYFELREFVDLHEDEVNPLVQSLTDCVRDHRVQIACEKLDDLLTKYIFALAKDYLNENRQTLYELCEGLPSPSWHRCIVQISLTIARLAPPKSSVFSCCTVSIIKANISPLMYDHCKEFKTVLSGPDYAAFFCLAA